MGMSYVAPHRKLLWHVDSMAHLKRGLPLEPLSAEVDLSNRCSLGCEFCHFAYTHTRGPLAGSDKPADAVPGGDLMDTKLAKNLVEQLSWGPHRMVKSVIWTGGGEPTLHPDFNEIIEHTHARLEQGIYTHGGHINQERADLMKRVFTWVNVSLDAINAEDYKRMKGVDRFNAACDGVERLVKAKGEATIGLSFMITRYNSFQARDMKKLGHALGADYVRFRPTIRYDQNEPNKPGEHTGWVNHALQYMNKYKDSDYVLVEPDRFEMYRDWNGHGYSTCYWAGLQVCITPNGKVWTCVNKREHPAAEIGDLSVDPWKVIRKRLTMPAVDQDCRVMCRGHVANQMLDQVMNKPVHENFI
jgi:MoaA/NifB/PqqE/SkfB family radical SAM enzyme